VFERVKTVHALDQTATVTGQVSASVRLNYVLTYWVQSSVFLDITPCSALKVNGFANWFLASTLEMEATRYVEIEVSVEF
jgi:hypothetical protein